MFEKEPHLQRLWSIIRLLPTALFFWVTLGLTACYAWDRYKVDDGERDFPMISHMGAYPPQSCFFTLILCLAAFFLFVIVLIQHRLVLLNLLNKDQLTEQESCLGWIKSRFNILNDVSFLAGVLCAFFLSVVGSFQTQNLSDWHRAGFVGFIVLGFIYLVLLSVLTFSSAHYWLKWGRVALTILLALNLIAFVPVKKVAYSQFDQNGTSNSTGRHSEWKDTDGGYKPYFIAAMIEFVAMVLFLVLIWSLQFDFWKSFDDICDTKRRQENDQGANGYNGMEADQRLLDEEIDGVPLDTLAEPEG